MGRYVFYLKRLGIDIEGIDFSKVVIDKLNSSKNEVVADVIFSHADVKKLPYDDNSLSGYISLGVIEHFIEGPDQVFAEAFRVLRPGGVAIVTTPNVSFLVIYKRLKRAIKNIIKRLVGRKIATPAFFQYEFTPSRLKALLKKQGFHVSRAEGFDLLYPFCEIGGFAGKNLGKRKFAYVMTTLFENSPIKIWGGQSVVIAVKKAPLMHCFLCGELAAKPESLNEFDVPISRKCQETELATYFKKGRKVMYSTLYEINPSIHPPTKKKCDFSGEDYFTDRIFEDFGFNKNVSPKMLVKPDVNLDLAANHVKPIWRKRSN